jgi:hypothetical protein
MSTPTPSHNVPLSIGNGSNVPPTLAVGGISDTDGDVSGQKFWTTIEIARYLKLSPDTVRRMFRFEPGVLRFRRRTWSKRRYETLRIPDDVLRRVIGKYSIVKNNR